MQPNNKTDNVSSLQSIAINFFKANLNSRMCISVFVSTVEPQNGITLGPRQTYNIYLLITLTEW
jgi:hypothetical protein